MLYLWFNSSYRMERCEHILNFFSTFTLHLDEVNTRVECGPMGENYAFSRIWVSVLARILFKSSICNARITVERNRGRILIQTDLSAALVVFCIPGGTNADLCGLPLQQK